MPDDLGDLPMTEAQMDVLFGGTCSTGGVTPAIRAHYADEQIVATGGVVTSGIDGVRASWVPAGRALRDALPTFTARRGGICFHDPRPKPTEGATATCSKCGQVFVAKFKRPKRTPESDCYECGHTTPRGPKLPKRWMWVEQKPASVVD